jgi:CHAT domain-containing protein
LQNNLANAYRDRIRGSKIDNLQTAIRAYEAALTVFTPKAYPRQHLSIAPVLGRCLLLKHDWSAAQDVYVGAYEAFDLVFGQGLDDIDEGDVIATSGPLFSEAAYAAIESGALEQAFDFLMEGKARLLAVSLRLQSLDLPQEKKARVTQLRNEIRDENRRKEEPGQEGELALQHLLMLREELGALVREGKGWHAPRPTVRWELRRMTSSTSREVMHLLSEGGAIVAPLITVIGGKVLLVTGEKDTATDTTVVAVPRVIDLPDLTTARLNEIMIGRHAPKIGGWFGAYAIQDLPEAESEKRFEQWIDAIESIGPDLWRLFAGALDKELTARGIKPGGRLIVLPTAALGLLPLGLARDPKTGRRLGETYEIVEAPSLEALAAAMHRLATPAAPTLAAVANPTGLIHRLALPFTETEGLLVEAHFKPASMIVLDKSNATPESVLKALKGKSYWHFSSHGSFDWKDARNSGLEMKDGQLSIGRLQEEQGALGSPRLVVLSACETGLYETDRNPEEFVGLPATFMELGAAGVVGALWQVDDAATAFLVAKFYDLHMDQGLSPPAALKAAQAWLRTSTRADLIAYGQAAVKTSRLSKAQFAALEGMVRTDKQPKSRRRAARFAPAWNFVQSRAAHGNTVSKGGRTRDLSSRPFEHPYYWGAFVSIRGCEQGVSTPLCRCVSTARSS